MDGRQLFGLASGAAFVSAGFLQSSPAGGSTMTVRMPTRKEADTVIFFSPHQDDETISMAVGIQACVQAGQRVIVVTVIGGRESGAIKAVNNRLRAEGRPVVNAIEFANARDVEQVAACSCLGVAARDIFAVNKAGTWGSEHRNAIRDGQRGQAQFIDLVTQWHKRYPHAALATMSWLDWHPDHAHLGYAVDLVARRYKVPARFFQSPLYQPSRPAGMGVRTPGGLIPSVETPAGRFLASPDKAALRRAVAAYSVWNPARHRLSVGHYSVAGQLDHTAVSARSWMHLDSTHWTSASSRHAAAQWVATWQGGRFEHPSL